MKINQAFPSKYLSKEDVKEPKVCVIESVAIDELDGDDGKENKPTVYFSNEVKPLILNRVNWMTIADLYGEDSDTWKGNSIEAYCDPSIMFGAKRVGGVRVRKPTNGNGHAASRDELMAQLKDLREKIADAKGELPDKKTLMLRTNEEIETAITYHKQLLEQTLEKAMP